MRQESMAMILKTLRRGLGKKNLTICTQWHIEHTAHDLQIARWRREGERGRGRSKMLTRQVDKQTNGKGGAAQSADDRQSKMGHLPVRPITLGAR